MTITFSKELSGTDGQSTPPGFFDLTSRIGRAQFLIITLAGGIPIALCSAFSGTGAFLAGDLYWPLNLLSIVASVYAGTRRAADLDVSRWSAAALIIPIINLLVFLWMAGTPGPGTTTKYGAPPPAHGNGMRAAAILLCVFIAICAVYGAAR